MHDEARRADEKGAPSFRDVLEVEAPVRAAPFWIGRAVAAAAAMVVLAASLRLAHRAPETRLVRIETWKPPTDFLLGVSFTDLFDTTPALPPDVPDYAPLLTREEEKANEKGKKS